MLPQLFFSVAMLAALVGCNVSTSSRSNSEPTRTEESTSNFGDAGVSPTSICGTNITHLGLGGETRRPSECDDGFPPPYRLTDLRNLIKVNGTEVSVPGQAIVANSSATIYEGRMPQPFLVILAFEKAAVSMPNVRELTPQVLAQQHAQLDRDNLLKLPQAPSPEWDLAIAVMAEVRSSVTYVDNNRPQGEFTYAILEGSSVRGLSLDGVRVTLAPKKTEPPVVAPRTRYIFVTKQQVTGSMGGLAGADAFCTSEASTVIASEAFPQASSNTWTAFLADSSHPLRTRITGTDKDKFYSARGAELLAEGVAALFTKSQLGSDWKALTSADGQLAIQTKFWLGNAPDGASVTGDCSGWTSTQPTGVVGHRIDSFSEPATLWYWVYSASEALMAAEACSNSQPLICISQ